MDYRLGLDIGANSIGWCCLSLDGNGRPAGILGLGVRVYPDGRNPKDGSSLAAARRGPRAMRRNRDRYLRRRASLLNTLTRYGLMPEGDEERRQVAALDPYRLRAEALARKLAPHELGRVVFHINQRRGFKSNRKSDRGANEGGLIRDATARTAAELARSGRVTIGGWLAERHARRQEVRVRLAGSGKTEAYPFYPSRELVESEFDVLWGAQSAWNPDLTEAMRIELRRIVFHQRPLRTPSVGRCWLEPEEPRAPRALPTTQRFRIAQTLAHLRVTSPGEPERALSPKERALLSDHLRKGKELGLDKARRLLGLPPEADFNTREDKLVGDATAARLGAPKAMGSGWHALSLEVQDEVVATLLDAEEDMAAAEALAALGVDQDAAERAIGAMLPDGHAALSLMAMQRILPHLEAGMRYSDAVQAAGYAHHSDTRTGELRDFLPYYGEVLFARIGTGSGKSEDPTEKRFGRAPNPTVHVALNELRRVVNAIIDRHGPPVEIVVETLRELGRSAEQRRQAERENKRNREKNDWRRALLDELGEPPKPGNLMRLRLWEEQAADPKNRCCPYSGTPITPRMAISNEVEEDHILPFAATLDDSAANRVLVTREANRAKAKQTPWQAFGHTPDWPAIASRAALLPPNKRWRFEPNAETRFAPGGDFLARHLTDSATIAIWAVEYLRIVAPPEKVWSAPGRLTALLRRALGLNSDTVLGRGGARKDRTDHRHHAIDAVVIGLTDRSLLQRVSVAARRAEERGERLLVTLDPPWSGFVADVAERARAIVVSHKSDTGWQAALHNDTAYGPIAGAGAGEPNVVVRRPLLSLESWSAEEVRVGVRDPVLADRIAQAVAARDATTRKTALAAMTHSGGHAVRRVRTVERLESRSVQPIRDRRTGRPYKLVKRDGNHRIEVWRLPSERQEMRVISLFEAAEEAVARQAGRRPPDLRPHPAAKLLMRLHKNDIVAFGQGDRRRLLRVVKMRDGQVTLAPHNEGGNLKARDADRNDDFKYVTAGLRGLRDNKARKVWVDPAGRVHDPGPML